MTACSTSPTDFPTQPARDARRVVLAVGFAIRGVGKRFDDKTVLGGIDLEVVPGQFVAVIGKAAAASRLVAAARGADRPTGGTIDHGDSGRGDADTRMMFQEPRLLPGRARHRQCRRGLTGIAKGAKGARRALLARLPRSGFLRARRRMAGPVRRPAPARGLARALVGEPASWRWTSRWRARRADPIDMQALLERIWRDRGFSAVLVTHVVAEAVVLADRVVVLDHGRIALDLPVPLPRPGAMARSELGRLRR